MRYESTNKEEDGTYTINYFNKNSVVASTTGNYTGIYDMAAGSHEYVMGYTAKAKTVGGSSGITSIYADFLTNDNWKKYYDLYTSTSNNNFNNRILGDATGEMGPFWNEKDADGNSRVKMSWYKDFGYFANSDRSWFHRGGMYQYGTLAGIFATHSNTGAGANGEAFRIILTPL